MCVLITGGAGRLGIQVCKAFLDERFQVRVFDLDVARNRKRVKELGGKAEILWGDITQPDLVRQALEQVDAVVHMAAVLPPVAYERPDLAVRVNVEGTKTLVDAIKEKGGQTPLVYTSSDAVFGPTPDAVEPLSPEKNEPHPKGTYGQTKLQAENLIKEAEVDYVILRLTVTMYPIFQVSDLRRMFTIPLNNRIEFCHSHDAALAIVNAVKRFDSVKRTTLVISGGPGQRMLYKDMIGAVLDVLGLPLPPAWKFTQEPYYLDWYDTSRSQQLLQYQEKTFADYLEDYRADLTRRYSPLFLPFMRWFVGPVFGKLLGRLF